MSFRPSRLSGVPRPTARERLGEVKQIQRFRTKIRVGYKYIFEREVTSITTNFLSTVLPETPTSSVFSSQNPQSLWGHF